MGKIFWSLNEADSENLFSKVEGTSWDSDKQEVVKFLGKPSSFKQLENSGVKISNLRVFFLLKTHYFMEENCLKMN